MDSLDWELVQKSLKDTRIRSTEFRNFGVPTIDIQEKAGIR